MDSVGFSRSAWTLGKSEEHLAKRTALIGNSGCRGLLVLGSPEEIRKTVRETIEWVAPGGGYLIRSSNSIHPNCKAENYITVVGAAGVYGIIWT